MNFVRTTNSRDTIRLTGAVYTPDVVANALTDYVAPLLPHGSLRVLEPSVGDGAFLRSVGSLQRDLVFVGVDINSDVIDQLTNESESSLVDAAFYCEDFLTVACQNTKAGEPLFDLIIGNPPFIRKHNFSESFKNSLKFFADEYGYPLKDLKNSWAAFLIASSELVADDGVVAFVIPYELITVEYGHKALMHLSKKFSRIDLFISDEKAFPEIDQDANIFVGRKKTKGRSGILIQRVSSMSSLDRSCEYYVESTTDGSLALELNGFLLGSEGLPFLRQIRNKTKTVGDFCSSSPGIVTAANDFFILPEAKAKELSIREFTIPVLKKGSFSTRFPIFTSSEFDRISKREPCRMLRIGGHRKDLSPRVVHYIEDGEKRGLQNRYKCRNRRNWYEVPIVERAPAFFFKRSHEYPRLCINEADVYITDTAYGLRLRGDATVRGLCFSFYNSLTLDFGDRWLMEDLKLNDTDINTLRSAWSSVRSHRLRHGRAK